MCFESSSRWCRAAGSGSARGRRSAGGSPGTRRPPARPAASFPSQGQGAQALLSAGLSPRAVASSLKEGRSLGLGAQQRCISLASREGQPSGCGSFVFPDCSPGVGWQDGKVLGRGVIPSAAALCCQGGHPAVPEEREGATMAATARGAPRTCEDLIVRQRAVRHLPMREDLPHEHAEGPHVRLGGELVLQHGFGRHPAQRDPGLAEVVVLAAGRTGGR